MRALVFTDLGVVKVMHVPEVLANDGDIIVNVDRAGICGSETHGIRTSSFRVPPLIMGHEFVGHTSDGQRVAINPLISCSKCDLCQRGLSQLCRKRALLGAHRAGGFADRVAVPALSLHKLPDDLDWDRAALIEPVANAVHAWSLADAPTGQRIGIIGCGPIGLSCLEVAIFNGAGSVTCVDLSPERRDVAKSIGAQEVDVSLDGEFDIIFDAVGSASTRRMSIEKLVPGGTTVWLGLQTSESEIDAANAIRFEKNIRGSFAYTDSEFIAAIQLAPHLDLTWTTTYPLEEGAKIFTQLMNGATTPIKALLRP
jgi:threonine dehydrogenase-like Zn-dependent dehydrogenase